MSYLCLDCGTFPTSFLVGLGEGCSRCSCLEVIWCERSTDAYVGGDFFWFCKDMYL